MPKQVYTLDLKKSSNRVESDGEDKQTTSEK